MSLVELLIITAIVAVLAGLLLPIPRHKPSLGRLKLTRVDMATLANALNAYRDKRGAYPPGDLRAMVEVLNSRNPDQTNYFGGSFQSINKNGEPIDWWRTPYRIETNSTNGLSIRSAGPNRLFGDADDLEQSL